MMGNCDWLVEAQSMKDVWRSAIMKNGELSVMMDSTVLMHRSSADKWDTPKWVRLSVSIFVDIDNYARGRDKQEQWRGLMQHTVKEPD